jgi:hypothetical protein
MSPVVMEEMFECTATFGFTSTVTEGALDEHGRAVADVTFDELVRDVRAAHRLERGVHREGEIELRIDQRSVKIKDQRAHTGNCFVQSVPSDVQMNTRSYCSEAIGGAHKQARNSLAC